MAAVLSWLWKVLAVLGLAGYQYLVHWTTIGGDSGALRIGLVWLPIVLLAVWVVTRAGNKLLWWSVLLAACASTYLLEYREHLGLALSYGIPHAATYLFLSWLFLRTLAPGAEALITRLARRVHGSLSPAMEAHTRRVTLLWGIFFAAQVVVSGLLFRFASLNAWSFFINVLNLPLVGLMFGVDYAYRVARFPGEPQATIAQAIQAFVKDSTASNSPEAR
jgi:uncharacterized membrane protein